MYKTAYRELSLTDRVTENFNIIKQNNNEIQAYCPACNKDRLYLSIEGNKILVDCKHGCELTDIADALGVKQDFFFLNDNTNHKPTGSGNSIGHIAKENNSTNQTAEQSTSLSSEPLPTPKEQKINIFSLDYIKTQFKPYDDKGTKIKTAKFNRCHSYLNSKGTELAIKAIWNVTDENGTIKKKLIPFLKAKKGYSIGLNGLKLPLYNLPKVIEEKDTVFIVEGEKDADTICKMGFTGTTSPNGAGSKWNAIAYNRYLSGKNLIIISDNDGVGEQHAQDIAKKTISVAKSIKIIDPLSIYPELKAKGDITDIVEELGLNEAKERLEQAVEFTPDFRMAKKDTSIFIKTNSKGEEEVQPNELAEIFKRDYPYFIITLPHSDKIMFFLYLNGVYRQTTQKEVESKIAQYIREYDKNLITSKVLHEVYYLLTIDEKHIKQENDINTNEHIINLKNGLYDIEKKEFMPHTPKVLSTIQINCNYAPEEKESPIFDNYLDTLTNGDINIKIFLLQYMAVCISNINGYRFKKALIMYGQGDTGKSQLLSLTNELVGKENFSSCDLSILEKPFGTSLLYHKRLTGNGDMSFLTINELKTFKSVTGGDNVMCEFKNLPAFAYKYKGMLWYCANALPHFGGDKGKWVYDRFILIKCDNVIPEEKRDKKLLDKMLLEKDAILNKLLELLEGITEDYLFAIPKKCLQELESYKDENSTVRQYLKECCTTVSTLKISNTIPTTGKIYEYYKKFCKLNGIATVSNRTFQKELLNYFDILNIKDIVKKYYGNTYYTNFILSENAKRELDRITLY